MLFNSVDVVNHQLCKYRHDILYRCWLGLMLALFTCDSLQWMDGGDTQPQNGVSFVEFIIKENTKQTAKQMSRLIGEKKMNRLAL